MMGLNAAMILVASLAMATTPVYSYHVFRSNEVREQESEGLVAEMESLDREVAEVMEELEKEERAVMQNTYECCKGPECQKGRQDLLKDGQLKADATKYIVNTPADVACNEARSITLHQLMKMANSMLYHKNVFPVKDNKPTSYTYLPAPKKDGCPKLIKPYLYTSGQGPCHGNTHTCQANWKDSEMYLIGDCSTVTKYWSAWTPCVYCQWSLMNWKANKLPNTAVNLYVGTMYDWGNKPTTEACMSLMMEKGFQFTLWSWTDFANAANFYKNGDCRKVINLIDHCTEFTTEIAHMQKSLKKATDDHKGSKELAKTCVKPKDFVPEVFWNTS